MSTDSRDMLSILAGPDTGVFTTRPVIMGTHGMVTSGHYLARTPYDDQAQTTGSTQIINKKKALQSPHGTILCVLDPQLHTLSSHAPSP